MIELNTLNSIVERFRLKDEGGQEYYNSINIITFGYLSDLHLMTGLIKCDLDIKLYIKIPHAAYPSYCFKWTNGVELFKKIYRDKTSDIDALEKLFVTIKKERPFGKRYGLR